MPCFSQWSSSSFLLLLVTCVPPQADSQPEDRSDLRRVRIRVVARAAATTANLECPPFCMQKSGGRSGAADTTIPIEFTVCSAATGCFQLPSGQAAEVSPDATILAPDGFSPGQRIGTFEPDHPVTLLGWADGVRGNPRRLVVPGVARSGNPLLEFIVFYHFGTLIDPNKEAVKAGCPVSNIDLFFSNRHWVERHAGFHQLEGPVMAGYVSRDDYPWTHYSQDYEIFVLLSGEQPYQLLARNLTTGQYGDRPNQIGVEWEVGSLPQWARPWGETNTSVDYVPGPPVVNDGDRVWVTGKYIFDCGHPSNDLSLGAHTEIHHPIGIATMRGIHGGKIFVREDIAKYLPELTRDAKGLQGVKVDVWFNGDGGQATEILRGGSAFSIRGVHDFEVPLPRPPSPLHPRAKFRVKALRLQPGQPAPQIVQDLTPGKEKLKVTIDLQNYTDTWKTCTAQAMAPLPEHLTNCRGDAYGTTIIAGWEIFTLPADLRQIEMTLDEVKVLDDSEGEGGDGEFNLDLALGPSTALGGDVLQQVSSLSLHQVNPDLLEAPGDGESYPLFRNGQPLRFVFRVRDDASAHDSNFLSFRLTGFEDDPIWDDGLPTIDRLFPHGTTIWSPYGPPDWAGCPPIPPPPCEYGSETLFGLIRGTTVQPIPYEDEGRDYSGRVVGGHAYYAFKYRLREVTP